MPVYFQNPPFMWIIATITLLALIFGVRAYLAYQRLPKEASDDWDYQVTQNMQDLRLTKDAYVRAYKKVNAPRGVLYVAGFFSAILVLTPIAFAFINSILMTLWNSSDEPVEISIRGGGVKENVESLTYEPGNMVWGFFTFFGILAIWTLIAAMTARRFYRNAPGLMRDELIEERANFKPTVPLTVAANPAHVKASPESRNAMANLFVGALGLEKKTNENFEGSGLACDQYSDGSGMDIYVHVSPTGLDDYPKESHPFFSTHEYAREDDKEKIYTIISLQDDLLTCFENIEKTGLYLENEVGKKSRTMRGFRHANLEFYIYQT